MLRAFLRAGWLAELPAGRPGVFLACGSGIFRPFRPGVFLACGSGIFRPFRPGVFDLVVGVRSAPT